MKVGHAGTLDPAATGVLPVLLGKATRVAEYLVNWDKQYRAVLRLGETTDTQDATGTVLRRAPVAQVTEAEVREAVARFVGRIRQVPPMYSAVKVAGVPLYKAARAGRNVERHAREVTVARIDVLAVDLPDVTLRVTCSKGTYIRTLCADIGEALGVGGHLLTLDRERTGPLTVEQALTVEEVESRLARGTLGESLLTLDAALAELPACTVGPDTARRVVHGAPVSPRDVTGWEPCGAEASGSGDRAIRIKDQGGRLLAIGTVRGLAIGQGEGQGRAEGSIAVTKVFVSEGSDGREVRNLIEE